MSEQGEAVKLQEYATDKQIEFFDRLRSGDDPVHEEARTELVKLADQTLELLDSLDASKVESEPGVPRIRTRLAIIAGHQVEEFTLDVYEEGYDPSDDQLMADLTDGAKARITTEMLEAGKLYIFSAYYAADKRVPEGCDVEGAVRAMFDAPDSKEKRHFLRFVRNVTKDAVANKAAAAAGFYDIYALYAAAVNRPLAVLRHLLQLAVEEWEVLDRAPRIRLEREPEGRIVWLEPDEEARLLEASRASRTKHLARLLVTIGTGERPTAGRAPRANLGRVDFSRGVLRLENTSRAGSCGKLYRRTDKREQAQEHLPTATTMYARWA